MFFCGISGAAPLHPVVSTKSGHVYEKELIEKYIAQDGKDPITGEGLTKEDLIDVIAKPSTLPPRPTTQTSIPSLLTALQSEYDSIMLESVEIKKAFGSARQELANALYREDAATRAIARLLKERDEARQALATIQSTIGYTAPAANGAGGDVEMEVGAGETISAENSLPAEIEEVVSATHASLSATRKKRKPPTGYVNSDTLRNYVQTTSITSLHSTKPAGISALDLSADGNRALTGGPDKTVQVFDLPSQKTLATLKGHTKAITQVAWVDDNTAVSSSADKTVKLWSDIDSGKWSLAHNFAGAKGDIVGFSIHPSRKLVASASTDSTWSLHDLTTRTTVKTYSPIAGIEGDFSYSSFTGHPDGILHAGGTKTGSIRVWDVRDSSSLAGTLDGYQGESINSMSFSENGYYLATSSASTPTVKVFDLRKLALLSSWTLPAENRVSEVRFDASAQFLSVAGTDLRVYANKSWEELLKFDDNAGELTAARFTPLGGSIVVSGMDRTLRVLGTATA